MARNSLQNHNIRDYENLLEILKLPERLYWLTIVCPAIIAAVEGFQSLGIIELFGEKGAGVTALLAGIATAASVVFNIVTGRYKKPDEVANETVE